MKLFIVLLLFSSLSYASDKIKVMGLFNGKAYLNIAGQNKLLTVGDTYKGVTLLQATGKYAKIKNKHGQEVKLTTSGSVSSGGYKKQTKTSLKIYPDSNGMYQVKGLINGNPINFLIDTGATYVAMSERHAKKIGLNYKDKGVISSAQTASGIVTTWEVTLDSVEVGGIKINYVSAAVISGNHPYEVLLGMSYLKNIKVQHSGGAMLLQKKY
ncbi:MAG: retroviral-like aspartic protease family protein [Gammaproteobacteria bacterium]|nr:retroviral-like aspartic protease family protein [Gammaproteobacteria bacterium]